MTAIRRKLKSKSGISLAIALVFFLLCAMVGTVVLAAVSAAAGSTARERQLYRQTLALTSAADLLRREVEGMTFTGSCNKTETIITTVPISGGKTTVETEEVWTKGTNIRLTGSTLLEGHLDLEGLYLSNQTALSEGIPGPVSKAFTFQEVADKKIPEVTAELTVAQDYTLTAVLRCGENCMTLTSKPQSDVVTGVPNVTTSHTDNVAIKTTTTTYTTTLHWGAALITEGGPDATTP